MLNIELAKELRYLAADLEDEAEGIEPLVNSLTAAEHYNKIARLASAATELADYLQDIDLSVV